MMSANENHPESALKIAMFAAEAAPYAKVGGLGDVIGALPKALEKAGAKPVVVLPLYHSIDQARHNIVPCTAIPGFDVPIGDSSQPARVFQGRLPESGVDVFLIASEKYFGRAGIYDDPETKEGYADNAERFIFLMKSGLELLRRLGTPVDIIHCHDSHTALVPAILKMSGNREPFFEKTGTLLTIHNLAHQGLYARESLTFAGIDLGHFYPLSPLEYWGKVNFMKAGIELADKVNTVSRTYAIEIQTDHEFGMGLEGVLHNRKEDLSGIVNGIDYDDWDPEKDPLIPARFSKRDLSGKSKCKKHVLKHFGLPVSRARIPLIGVVSRLADQKGLDLIAEAAEEIAAMKLNMVVLGTGQQKYHDLLMQIAARYPKKFGVRLSFDNKLAHQIEAGCDIFLMPSKFEPCGLNQLYSLRYGTIPVVRATGGLADTVEDYDSGKGTGFCFSGYTSSEMVQAIRRALSAYADPARWQEVCVRAMSQDWSWNHSAEEYLKLYEEIRDSRL